MSLIFAVSARNALCSKKGKLGAIILLIHHIRDASMVGTTTCPFGTPTDKRDYHKAMNKEEKLAYLNALLNLKQAAFDAYTRGVHRTDVSAKFFSLLPKSLFKYRQFDKYTRDMIENEYLYLSPAETLDDPFECLVDLDISRYYDENKGAINKRCYQMIVEYVLAFVPEGQRDGVRQQIYACTTPQYTLSRSKALDVLMAEEDDAVRAEVPIILNALGNIPNLFQTPEMQANITTLVQYSIDARKETGICSLSEKNDSQVMWAMYSGNYTGYCVEYDFEHSVDAAVETYPVVYDDGRSNNAVEAILGLFVNSAISRMTGGKEITDQAQLFRILLAKNEEWSFQEEWRVLGSAGERIAAPRIKAIYVGRRANKGDLDEIMELSSRFGFDVYQTKANPKTLKIDFVKLK